MAPNGPRRGNNGPSTQRATRSSTSNGNAPSRGGIAKRPRATRTNRDGDVDMDAPAASNGTAHNRGGPSSRTTRSTTLPGRPMSKAQDMVAKVIGGGTGSVADRISAGIDPSARHRRSDTKTLKVGGLKDSSAAANDGGGLKELISFLERKASSVGKVGDRAIRIKKLNGDFVYITTNTADADEILKLNGFMFARATLAISECPDNLPRGDPPTMSATSQELKAILTSFLEGRYDVNTKLLNLSNLGQDAVLGQMEIFKEATPEKLFKALMAICDGLFATPQAKRDSLVSISLAGNNIDDVNQIWSLADTFPDLLNLDLSGNQFRNLQGLRRWHLNKRLRKLETLLLNNNPIEASKGSYRDEITSWFPRLQNLSGIQVRTPEQIAAAGKQNAPKPIPQKGPDFRDVHNIGENFVTEFIQMFDHDRPQLAAKYYDDHSTFSLAVNTGAPHPSNVQPPGWSAYIKLSRNLKKITTQGARHQRLFAGGALIQEAWQKLPPTRHPDIATHFSQYIVDCHPINGLVDPTGQSPQGVDGMVITLHGEFEDQDPDTKNTAKRSFSRTFVLGPGQPGRHIIRVISDMLSLKVYSPLPTSAATPAVAAGPPPVPTSPEEAQRLQMITALCERTGMTPEYSKMCLENANWNPDQALVSFTGLRDQLPPEAFASAAAAGMVS